MTVGLVFEKLSRITATFTGVAAAAAAGSAGTISGSAGTFPAMLTAPGSSGTWAPLASWWNVWPPVL